MSRYRYIVSLLSSISHEILLGMQKRNKVNVDLLTYDPTNKRSKRAKAGCVTGYCNTAQSGRTCDEVSVVFVHEESALTFVG
jgi:hypothetical protein